LGQVRHSQAFPDRLPANLGAPKARTLQRKKVTKYRETLASKFAGRTEAKDWPPHAVKPGPQKLDPASGENDHFESHERDLGPR
jgi:hypothetical protein